MAHIETSGAVGDAKDELSPSNGDKGGADAMGSVAVMNMAGNAAPRVSVAHYTAEEVIRQFLALYNTLDFKEQLEEVGVGRFQLLRRKKALREFRALCMALWGLALQKSFPNDASAFFEEFYKQAPALRGNGRELHKLQQRVTCYVELLAEKGDTDFSPAADCLSKELALVPNDLPKLRLKLSLIIRSLYTLIFNKLV